MNVGELKRGIADGSYVRNPDGSIRPASLREQLGLSVVRRLDPKRGITAQDIIRRENLRNLEAKRERERKRAKALEEKASRKAAGTNGGDGK